MQKYKWTIRIWTIIFLVIGIMVLQPYKIVFAETDTEIENIAEDITIEENIEKAEEQNVNTVIEKEVEEVEEISGVETEEIVIDNSTEESIVETITEEPIEETVEPISENSSTENEISEEIIKTDETQTLETSNSMTTNIDTDTEVIEEKENNISTEAPQPKEVTKENSNEVSANNTVTKSATSIKRKTVKTVPKKTQSTNEPISVNNEEEIKTVINNLNTESVSNAAVKLLQDVIISGTSGLSLKKGILTILGENHTLKSYLLVSQDATLNLGSADYDKTLTVISNNKANGIIDVSDSSTLNIYDGVTIGPSGRVGMAGGITAHKQSTINMYGGNIEDCQSMSVAGGVYLDGNSTFNMYDGTIKNCVGVQGGAVGLSGARPIAGSDVSAVTFNMYGGLIDNCVDQYVGGGGVCIYTGYPVNFNMEGGTISNCTNTTYGYGGGVLVYTTDPTSQINLNSGYIINNTGNYGGGIFIFKGDTTIKDDFGLYNNIAIYAGDDIYNNGANVTLGTPDTSAELKCGHQVDGWYEDAEQRWSYKDCTEQEEYYNIFTHTNELWAEEYGLKAAHGVIVEPVEPIEPTEPTEPTEPVEPIEPTEPVDVEPIEPTEPQQPEPIIVSPSEPIVPIKPTEPLEPAEPIIPVEPKKPEIIITPIESDEEESGNTMELAQPTKPTEPVIQILDTPNKPKLKQKQIIKITTSRPKIQKVADNSNQIARTNTQTTYSNQTPINNSLNSINSKDEIEIIEPTEVPKTLNQGTWALINLILVVLNFFIVMGLLPIKKKGEFNINRVKRINIITLLISIIIFILTEDITLSIALIDKWTVLMAILFLIEIANIFIIKYKNKETSE